MLNVEKPRYSRERFFNCAADYASVYPHDPQDQIRLLVLFNLLKQTNDLEGGDYIEVGTHVGMTLKFIYQFMDPTRELYSFDTFEGFDSRDIDAETAIRSHRWRVGNFDPTSAEKVGKYVGGGYCPTNVKIVPGWFPDSFAPYRGKHRWRFAHIDVDLYQPTKAALELLWPEMVPGGWFAIHDYMHTEFLANKAVDEFCETVVGVKPTVTFDRYGTAIFRKVI